MKILTSNVKKDEFTERASEAFDFEFDGQTSFYETLDEDKTPHFIKHGYVWRFNGIPKNQRTQIMSQLWNSIGGQYV